jgi:AcrR family transcriptional regulator
MAVTEPGAEQLGLRERKKQRTRETIARVAGELFAEQGFHDTTIRQIADAADVSPRTVSAYFPVKEELVFPDHDAALESLATRLADRAPGETTADALRAWIGELIEQPLAEHERQRCQRVLVESDPALRTYERGLQERVEQIIAAAVAVDLELGPDDLLPRMVGAATNAALDALGRDTEEELGAGESLALVDDAMAFIGAGLQALAARRDRS